jgi:hypothetical protein
MNMGEVEGLTGKIAIDGTDIFTERTSRVASLSEAIQLFTQGLVAKSFNLNHASLLVDSVAAQRVRPSSLYAADDDADPCHPTGEFYNSLLRDKFLEPRRSSQTTEIR